MYQGGSRITPTTTDMVNDKQLKKSDLLRIDQEGSPHRFFKSRIFVDTNLSCLFALEITMNAPLKVLLVDDSPMILRRLVSIVKEQPCLKAVGNAP